MHTTYGVRSKKQKHHVRAVATMDRPLFFSVGTATALVVVDDSIHASPSSSSSAMIVTELSLSSLSSLRRSLSSLLDGGSSFQYQTLVMVQRVNDINDK